MAKVSSAAQRAKRAAQPHHGARRAPRIENHKANGSHQKTQPTSTQPQGVPEAEGLEATRRAAPACLAPRVPAPAPSTSIPYSDDSSERPLAPLPSVEVRWGLLASAALAAAAEKEDEAEAEAAREAAAKLLETRLGVLQHVLHGAHFRGEHFEELMQMLRCKWDRSGEEEEAGAEAGAEAGDEEEGGGGVGDPSEPPRHVTFSSSVVGGRT